MNARRFSPFALGVSLYTLATILWGYYLRISESGDGCGTDWPLCHGSVVPLEAAFPTWVEYVHRLSSGSVLLLVGALLLWAFRAFPTGHAVRRSAGFALLFTVTESLFGALLVAFGLVAEDVSTARILIRPFHVTNTFLLMASLAASAWWAHRGVQSWPGRWPPRDMKLALLGVLALAWSGSWTGLAATAFPAESVREGFAQYLGPEHLLIYLRMIHPLVALAVVAYLVRVALAMRGEAKVAKPVRTIAGAVAVLAVAQMILGPLTILLLQPAGLRLLHLLSADLLWAAVVLLAIERTADGRDEGQARVERAAGALSA